jgi:hypothetical protein
VSFVSDDDRPAAIAQRIRHNAYLLQALRLVDRTGRSLNARRMRGELRLSPTSSKTSTHRSCPTRRSVEISCPPTAVKRRSCFNNPTLSRDKDYPLLPS